MNDRLDDDLRVVRPGWMARIFGLETARLIACDAHRHGDAFDRTEPFRFLYRSGRGFYFLLTTPRLWTLIEEDEAKQVFDSSPIRLCEERDAFPARTSVSESGDAREKDASAEELSWRVVRSFDGYFSVWEADRDLPKGWNDAGHVGTRDQCLAYIDKYCVHGLAPGRES